MWGVKTSKVLWRSLAEIFRTNGSGDGGMKSSVSANYVCKEHESSASNGQGVGAEKICY